MPSLLPPPRAGHCIWELCTPAVPGALAIIHLMGDVDAALDRLAIPHVPVGHVARRSLAHIDNGIVARWSPTIAQLMPHGGAAVTRSLLSALESAGFSRASASHPRLLFPEADDDVEAHMLAAIANAASPLAIDRLLSEPTRWREHAKGLRPICPPAVTHLLNHLIDPPLVVALGPPNIGKSTLLNALAGRYVSIVADEPGTTRDHVGITLDLAGLVVRYVDTPGLRPDADALEHEAQTLALQIAHQADLVLFVGDAHAPPLTPPPGLNPSHGSLLVALRHDLGPAPWHADLGVSALRSEGLESLASCIRQRLVPDSALEDPGAWPFWYPSAPATP